MANNTNIETFDENALPKPLAARLNAAIHDLAVKSGQDYLLGDSPFAVDTDLSDLPDDTILGVASRYGASDAGGSIHAVWFNNGGRDIVSGVLPVNTPPQGQVSFVISDTSANHLNGELRTMRYASGDHVLGFEVACSLPDPDEDKLFALNSFAAKVGISSLLDRTVERNSPKTEFTFKGEARTALGREVAFGLSRFAHSDPRPL